MLLLQRVRFLTCTICNAYLMIHVSIFNHWRRTYTYENIYTYRNSRVQINPHYKLYVFKTIRVANHMRIKSYTLQIIHVTNHTRMKWWHLIGRSATHPCPANHMRMKSYTLQIICVTNHRRMKWRHLIGRSATHPCPVLLSPRVPSRRGRSSVAKCVFYNMVCSALFLHLALYTVHCTI